MTKKLQPLEYVAAALEKDCREYSLGDVVREIIDLTIIRVAQGLEITKKSTSVIKNIDDRIDKLYAELDHREELYNYQEEKRA